VSVILSIVREVGFQLKIFIALSKDILYLNIDFSKEQGMSRRKESTKG
jgi:hypothetical protein